VTRPAFGVNQPASSASRSAATTSTKKRLADGAGFLRAIQHGDGLDGAGQGGGKRFDREWPVKADLEDAGLLAVRVQPGGCLGGGFGAGAHDDDYALSLGMAFVVKQVVCAPVSLANSSMTSCVMAERHRKTG